MKIADGSLPSLSVGEPHYLLGFCHGVAAHLVIPPHDPNDPKPAEVRLRGLEPKPEEPLDVLQPKDVGVTMDLSRHTIAELCGLYRDACLRSIDTAEEICAAADREVAHRYKTLTHNDVDALVRVQKEARSSINRRKSALSKSLEKGPTA